MIYVFLNVEGEGGNPDLANFVRVTQMLLIPRRGGMPRFSDENPLPPPPRNFFKIAPFTLSF